MVSKQALKRATAINVFPALRKLNSESEGSVSWQLDRSFTSHPWNKST